MIIFLPGGLKFSACAPDKAELILERKMVGNGLKAN